MEAGRMSRQRLRAFDSEGWRLLNDGIDLPLFASSFDEQEESPELPSQWSEKLRVVKLVGQGGFGMVFQCQVLCQSGATYVTVKMIRKRDPRTNALVKQEIAVLEQMNGVSDYCISATGAPAFVETEGAYWLMMPYMNSGDLFALAQGCRRSAGCSLECKGKHRCWSELEGFSMARILALFLDVVKGVDAMHEKGMLHTDLKLENAMLHCQDKKCFAAVIDLGLACNMSKPGDCGWCGTPGYMPPEVWQQDVIGMARPSRDVWALGTMLYELLYKRQPPYMGDRNGSSTIHYNPAYDKHIPILQKQKRIDKLLVEMLLSYQYRPTIPEIIKELQDIISTDYAADAEAQSMAKLSPTDLGAALPTPPCLYETWGTDIGDLPFHREHCSDTPKPAEGYLRCGACTSFSCNPCCKCRVLRHKKVVKEYFRMQVCQ
ncbi:SAK [Symbiodinium pilosum]|uniref:SAK protein n=1 Tax=Symbiodinium pilosum TaxID=2952 RepID=A0A812P8V7_SYMPI|nr:SAK [Symbiodinium pilosum]